jgi:hypothetical protein
VLSAIVARQTGSSRLIRNRTLRMRTILNKSSIPPPLLCSSSASHAAAAAAAAATVLSSSMSQTWGGPDRFQKVGCLEVLEE